MPSVVSREGWRLGSGRWECAVCGRQSRSVTAGTIFHRIPDPARRLWFAAAWLMTSQKHGVSALSVQRSLPGLGSYQTAWAMLHRYRVAMVRPGVVSGWRVTSRSTRRMSAGSRATLRDAGPQSDRPKAIVAIAVEQHRESQGFGRIRLKHVPDVSAESLLPFIHEAIESGASVHTDGSAGASGRCPTAATSTSATVMRQQARARACGDAWCAPRSESAAALAAGHPPGACQPRAPRRVTSTNSPSDSIATPLATSRPSLLPAAGAVHRVTRSPTAASSSTRPRPAGDTASRLGPGASPSFRPSTVPRRENAAAMGLPDSNG